MPTDLDHESGVIHIQRGNWKGLITKPKTKKSQRSVPMVTRLAEFLRAHRSRMLAEQHPGLDAGWIFPTQRGTLHRGTPLGPVIHKTVKRAGIDVHLTPHGLRRTFNDLARRVAAAQVVRSIVGHVTETMTEHYSVIDAGEKQAVQTAVLRMVDGDAGKAERENSLAVRIRLPSGLKVPTVTPPVWPTRRISRWPVRVFHTIAVRSSLAVIALEPSGLNAIWLTLKS